MRFNMGLMSEGSLPPFKYLDPRRYPARLRDAAGRAISRFRRAVSRKRKLWDNPGTPGDSGVHPAAASRDVTYPRGRGISLGEEESLSARSSSGEVREGIGEADRERAAAALRRFLKDNATNVDRAARKRDQAERLEMQGIPSDSARNRADRARGEVVDGLSRLRRSLAASKEPGAALALDLELQNSELRVRPEELRR